MPVNEEENPRSEPGTWVVYTEDTGWSDESMRFATKREARAWINEKIMPWNFGMRYEA